MGTFVRLSRVPLGFDRDRVLLINANAAQTGVSPEGRGALFRRFVEAVRAVPGVAHAAASTSTPVSATDAPVTIQVVGQATQSRESREAKSVFVTPGWFATYGVPLRVGRDVGLHDAKGALPVMVVNEAFATRFLPGKHPVGESAAISVGARGEMALGTRTIVGVVGNAVYRSLREPTQPTVYVPLAQWDYPIPMPASIAIGVRAATAPPSALSSDVSRALAAIEPQLALTIRPLADQVHQAVQQEQLLAALSMLFGVIALFLAAIGLYGVTSYTVARRRAEIGVRVAVGASSFDIMKLLLSRVLAAVAVGVALGAGVSAWLSRFVTALLYGVMPGDPVTIAIAAVALVAVALCAAWVSARRALRIDPAEVLRVS
jgi:predicted permease